MVILAVVTVIGALSSVIAWWADGLVSDTDTYVATVAPLVDEPAVQDALATQITNAILNKVDLSSVTAGAAEALGQRRDLSPLGRQAASAIGAALAGFLEDRITQTVGEVVASPQFAATWEEANRQAHTQTVAVLKGQDSDLITVTDDEIGVNMASFIAAVKDRLTTRGIGLADRIPETDATFVLVKSADLGKAQWAFRMLNTLRYVLPIVTIAAAAGVVLAARRRRRAVAVTALSTTVLSVLVLLGLRLVVSHYAGAGGVLTVEASTDVYNAVLSSLRHRYVWLGVLGLVAAALALWLPKQVVTSPQSLWSRPKSDAVGPAPANHP